MTLTESEARMLRLLEREPTRVFTFSELEAGIGYGERITEGKIREIAGGLRAVLRHQRPGEDLVVDVWGCGYRLREGQRNA